MEGLKKLVFELRERFSKKEEEGAALIIAMVVLMALEVLGFSLAMLSEIDISTVQALQRGENQIYAAMEGAFVGLRIVGENTSAFENGGTITSGDPRLRQADSYEEIASYRESLGQYEYGTSYQNKTVSEFMNWYYQWTAQVVPMEPVPAGSDVSETYVTGTRYVIISTSQGARANLRQVELSIAIRSKGLRSGGEKVARIYESL